MRAQVSHLLAKLSGQTDFTDWHDTPETIPADYKAMDIVDGTSLKHKDKGNNSSGSLKEAREKEQAQWNQKNRWAKAFPVPNISREVRKTMEKTKSAANIWKMLEAKFDIKTIFTFMS